MRLVGFIAAAIAWAVAMGVCLVEGHPGWTVVLGIFGALTALDWADRQ